MDNLKFINELEKKNLSVEEYKWSVLEKMKSEFESQTPANKIERIGRQTSILISDTKDKIKELFLKEFRY